MVLGVPRSGVLEVLAPSTLKRDRKISEIITITRKITSIREKSPKHTRAQAESHIITTLVRFVTQMSVFYTIILWDWHTVMPIYSCSRCVRGADPDQQYHSIRVITELWQRLRARADQPAPAVIHCTTGLRVDGKKHVDVWLTTARPTLADTCDTHTAPCRFRSQCEKRVISSLFLSICTK